MAGYPKASGDPMSPGMPNPMEGGMGDEALEAHAAAMLRAIKGGDAKALSVALKAAVEACYDSGESGEGEM